MKLAHNASSIALYLPYPTHTTSQDMDNTVLMIHKMII
jgi:hypothetical protein